MAKLENITVDELREALDEVEDKKPTQRVMLAIIYKQGPSVPTIANWFDMRKETIYSWFSAMESEPLMDAIVDDPRPGRPPKLTEKQSEAFRTALHQSPEMVGYDETEWTPQLAQEYLQDEFAVEYSRRHVRRILETEIDR
ncbi:MAG: transposase [Halobacteriaceae archaeon]